VLTAAAKKLIVEQRLGFVATVDEDGSPNLSPKGTMLVIDDATIAFADIRSPRTRLNVSRDGRMEVNFVDPFARKGFRLKGLATYVALGAPGFDALLNEFEETWPSLLPRIGGIVILRVERLLPVTTPPYDTGTTEDELRAYWTQHYRALQPGGDFVQPGKGWTA
jgi:uncharacterized protein